MRQYPAPITDRKIRFALVGCGRIANNHFEALRKHQERADLVGVCDVDPRALDVPVRVHHAERRAARCSGLASDTRSEHCHQQKLVHAVLR